MNNQNGHEEGQPEEVFDDDGLRILRSEADLRAALQLRQSAKLFLVEDFEIFGKVQLHHHGIDVVVGLRGEKGSQQFSHPIFRSQDLVRFAKDVLLIFEPQALESDNEVLQRLRWIQQHLEKNSDN